MVNIRVIIYLSAKRFDVYLDGKKDPVKGSWISFRNIVADINCFYISTYASGTDSLRMHYLTIVKGFVLYERFLNGKSGVVPDYWGATPAGGVAAPAEWATTNPQDLLSMKLEDSSVSQQASLNRYFAASGNKMLWEYKFKDHGM